MAEDHQDPGLVLGVGELVEHGLHAAVVQGLAVFDFGMVAEHLEHSLQRLPGADRAGARDAVGQQFHADEPLGDDLRLLLALVGYLAVMVALVVERFRLRVPHDQQHVGIVLRLFLDLAEIHAHSSGPFRTTSLPPLWQTRGARLPVITKSLPAVKIRRA